MTMSEIGKGIVENIQSRDDIHENLKWVDISMEGLEEPRRFSIFGSLRNINIGDAVTFNYKTVEKDGRTFYNLKGIKKASADIQQKLIQQKREDAKAFIPQEVQNEKGEYTRVALLKLLNEEIKGVNASISGITERLDRIEKLFTEHFEMLMGIQNMTGTIIENLPGVASKRNRQKAE